MQEKEERPEKLLRLKHVRLVTVPVFDSVALQGGGCDPYFHIKVRNTKGKMIKIYDYKKNNKVKHIKSKEKKADIDCTNITDTPPPLRGDIKMIFYDYDSYSSDDKMFHIWFNTGYVENNYLRFSKAVTDKACKDLKNKHFSDSFEIELFFEQATDSGIGIFSILYSLFIILYSFHGVLLRLIFLSFVYSFAFPNNLFQIGGVDYETMVLDGSDEDRDTDEEDEALEAATKEEHQEQEQNKKDEKDSSDSSSTVVEVKVE